ncbi:metalloregulator ArsR/SmtB family transcription factor [Hymenobacter latericus]|uniref:metalloregulator ArsR/SmtB family transcription factor n=1 Tax=Hymenobacter sp. YIM 151858-1 TaxID=2987688 RepID=UPI0022271228|nr:metalloregulator ArsR/SmtB family transcription factor [Hymenobacter sp. YIM 151858-1]UYZ61251.1 metalloregulator ArsR/SmtB family transcription factor [Hymenobacter sp. YIM 151858-1]
MEKRAFKDAVYGQLADLTKALANPRRLEIVDLLAQGEFAVEDIARETGLSVANASQHLQVLKGVQLVSAQRDGHYLRYRLANPDVYAAWQLLRTYGLTRQASIARVVQDFRRQRDVLQTVTIDELLGKLAEEGVVLLDVRPRQEYNQGHLPQALSTPLEELLSRLQELPRTSPVVAYCRGPFCVFADEAVQLLTARGYVAQRLEEGFPDWKHRNLPYELA